MAGTLISDALSYCRSLAKVRAYVDANPQKVVSLAEAAEKAGLEATHLSKTFFAATGIHFKQWITAGKVAQAELLLVEHDYSITEVASMIGYGDVRSLQRAFRAHRQMTPFQFRQAVKKSVGAPSDVGARLIATDSQELSRDSRELPRKTQNLPRRGE